MTSWTSIFLLCKSSIVHRGQGVLISGQTLLAPIRKSSRRSLKSPLVMAGVNLVMRRSQNQKISLDGEYPCSSVFYFTGRL